MQFPAMFKLIGHTFRAREKLDFRQEENKMSQSHAQRQCRHAQHLPANFANLSNRISAWRNGEKENRYKYLA